MPVRPIPERYHTVTPFVVAREAANLIDFMRAALGAEVTERMEAPDGASGPSDTCDTLPGRRSCSCESSSLWGATRSCAAAKS